MMKIDPRHLATAHLWLYSVGLEPTSLDTSGETAAESLAMLLARTERNGRREAAAQYVNTMVSGEYDASEVTGEYDMKQLDALLSQAGGE